jgi:hypothetical protein
MARATECTKAVSKDAARPMLCGNMLCLNEPTPWRHSAYTMNGILRRDFSALSRCTLLYCEAFVGYLQDRREEF